MRPKLLQFLIAGCLLSIQLSTSSAFAASGGSMAGGGGNIVVCRDADGKIISTELLDYYEARTLRKFEIMTYKDVPDTTKYILKSLSERMPTFAAELKKDVANFNSNANFVSGVELSQISDSEHLYVSKGCAAEQVAIQRESDFPGDKVYTINKDLWDVLSPKDQAGLILHEVIYRKARQGGAANSIGTRNFNGLIASTKMNDGISTYDLYNSAPKEISPSIYYIMLDLNILKFYENKDPQVTTVAAENYVTYFKRQAIKLAKGTMINFSPNRKIELIQSINQEGLTFDQGAGKIEIESTSNLALYDDTTVKAAGIKYYPEINLNTPVGILTFSSCNNDSLALRPATTFSANGLYESGCELKTTTEFQVNGDKVKIAGHSPIAFYSTGSLKYGKIAKDFSGFKAGSFVYWNEDGTIATQK